MIKPDVIWRLKGLLLVIYSLSFMVAPAPAQSRIQDSLLKRLKQEKNDTQKVKTLYALMGELDTRGDLPKADSVGKAALVLSKDLDYKIGQVDILGMLGVVYKDMGDYNRALNAHQLALKICGELRDTADMMRNVGNIGIVYFSQGDYPKALDYDFTALRMARSQKNTRVEANTLTNIGLVYWNQNDLNKAISFCDSATAIYTRIQDKVGIARNMGNVGVIYYNQHNYPKAHEYLEKALHMNEELGRKGGVIRNTNNIGNLYSDEGDYNKAREYYIKGLNMAQQLNDKSDVAISLGNIGEAYLKEKNYKDAEGYLHNALAVANGIGALEMVKAYNQELSDLYAETGQYQKALECYRKYSEAKDSLVNADKSKQIGKLEAKADYDKQVALAQAEDEKHGELALAESRRQNAVIVLIGSVALAVTIIMLTIRRSLSVTRDQKEVIEKQKVIVEEQKEIVEEKNEEILGSIMYAKRLQDAILPPLAEVQKHLPESFILYKPKAIVSGDFYWLQNLPLPVGAGWGEVKFIAACDCTGHGVPGAMVSVVCSNALNRAVKEFGITEPGKILDKVRELVVETFSQKDMQSDGKVQDGMDVSIASLIPSEGGILVRWAGANNPLWYVQDSLLKELPPDKQPVGSYEKIKPFTTHSFTVPVNSDATLYLFSDGYADQFGGEHNKKFKYKQLQQLIMENAQLPMEEQKQILEKKFEEWKGGLEQTDDVCVIGIRIQ